MSRIKYTQLCYAERIVIENRLRNGESYNTIRKEHEITQYIGIAIDEPKRLERLDGINKISLLAKYGYTEQMAMELCKKYNLLSLPLPDARLCCQRLPSCTRTPAAITGLPSRPPGGVNTSFRGDIACNV